MSYHLRKLPDFSTLLSGRQPRDDFGFQSHQLQIWYNNTETAWRDNGSHKHMESDEIFIVLRGQLTVDVEGEIVIVNPGEYVCFPKGVFHAVIDVETPAETLMIRAPSVEDKVYK